MKIGKVISVEFDRFRAKLFHTTKNSAVSLEGRIYYFGNIGSFLKTSNAIGEIIICEVIAILDHNTESKMYSDFNLDSSRELIIKPIGVVDYTRKFHLGIGIYPSLYSDVSIVTVNDLRKILEIDSDIEDSKIHESIKIGVSKNLLNYEVKININSLFNIHTAILGNSGSGKSNTISHIIQEVYRKQSNSAKGAKTIIFDVNGEYKQAFEGELGEHNDSLFQYYKPNEDGESKFILPYYLMNLDEWLAFLMASDRTQKPFWDKVLQQTFKFYKIFSQGNSNEEYVNYFKWKLLEIISNILTRIDSDTSKMTAIHGVLFNVEKIIQEYINELNLTHLEDFISELKENSNLNFGSNNFKLNEFISKALEEVDKDTALNTEDTKLASGEYFDYKFLKSACELVLLDEEGKGNSRIREYTSTMLTRLDYFLSNSDCDFLKEGEVGFNESLYLKDYLGISDTNEKQLIIIDTSELNFDMLELTTSLVSRLIYDNRRKKKGIDRTKNPVHLVLDEAHRYIRKDTNYLLLDNIFERIAREGRKYSLYLIVSSQRPSELSPTVLSQCGNYFIHRIQNEVDMKYIYSVLPYFTDDYVVKIKQALPGEALIFGNCVPMPLQVKIHKPVPDPNSANCIINEEWYGV